MNDMPATPIRERGIPRIDARLKVTGAALYASDVSVANPAYAVLVTSAIAKGVIAGIDTGKAAAVGGVIDILTHATLAGRIEPGKLFSQGGYSGSSINPTQTPDIHYAGEIVALVLAQTFEAATEAAAAVVVSYVPGIATSGFDSPGAETIAAAKASSEHSDPQVGDEAAAFATAQVKLEAAYATPVQHHNPIELFTTTCAWTGDNLTVWEPSQNVTGLKFGLAQQLGIDPTHIHVVSPYVGGAFGSRGSLTGRTALIAIAAQKLRRPVKLVATREQGFTIATYRAETRHRIRLGAEANGRLVSLRHDASEVTSRPDSYMVAGTDATTRLYACPNVASSVSIVHADRNTPGFMRAPAEVPYLFALESAMDELAGILDMDPIELRRVNDTQVEPIKSLPYTSRSLMPCFDAGAAAFDWKRRVATPGTMRDGDWVVGLGCAAAMYPTVMGPSTARVVVSADGTAKVQVAAHDIGTGAYTVIAMVASQRLGIAVDRIVVELGCSQLPPGPVAGGSNTTASVCNVVDMACLQLRARIAAAAVKDGPLAGADPATLVLQDGKLVGADATEDFKSALLRASNGTMEAYAENAPHGAKPDALQGLYRGVQALAGGARLKDRVQFAFGAEFVEVRVHRHTHEIRCPRMLGVFAAGRIVNPLTARSQLMGGLIWGVSGALHEATEIDRRTARYVNTNLAEYLIAVNADIGKVEVIMLEEHDETVNALGIKGVGELGNVGTNAAVANAVFNATGKRLRDLPIRLEQLLDAPAFQNASPFS